ncbi:MAG: hypothetical protein ACJ8C4_20450 [Gemmataceae bacterium]
MRPRNCIASALVALGFVVPALADAPKAPLYTFSTLKAPPAEMVRARAEAWLAEQGKTDTVTREAFDSIWHTERPLLDRLVDSLVLGLPEAGKVLADARDLEMPAPKELPAIFKDAKLNSFVKSNLALAYARSLSAKRVYEEALEALKSAVPEEVCDPAGYYFHRAVAEHALNQKGPAVISIARLIDDVTDAPERYRMVGLLMFVDMQQWKDEEKDLENIARMMDNIERRLDHARGGPKTQDLQKKVIFRLDEVIKEIENQIKNGSSQCPAGGEPQQQGNSNNPQSPQNDSIGGTNGGPGVVDPKKLKHLQENWGKLPEKERAKAMMEITKDLPPRYREVIENYFKTLAQSPAP